MVTSSHNFDRLQKSKGHFLFLETWCLPLEFPLQYPEVMPSLAGWSIDIISTFS